MMCVCAGYLPTCILGAAIQVKSDADIGTHKPAEACSTFYMTLKNVA